MSVEKKDGDKMTFGEKVGVGIFATAFISLNYLGAKHISKVLKALSKKSKKPSKEH